jgi:NAD(P)H-hydrate epimerase
VVAADINSGLNGDTGEGSLFVRSDLTVSIGDFKFGHFIGLAEEAMKDKVNVDIGIEIIGEVEDI